MRVDLPKFKSAAEGIAYMKAHKEELTMQKKQLPIAAEVVHYGTISEGAPIAKKAYSGDVQLMAGSIIIDAIANLAMWYDSYGDIMLPDSWKKSITEKGSRIPFLKNHSWSVDSKIAKTLEVYTMDVNVKDLGYKSDVKTAQALIFKAECNPSIDEKMYNQYKNGMVDQHSIGLQYMQIELGLNDPDEKAEYKVWQKYIDGIINREEAEKRGYFWAIKEAKIYENSAVLFGANIMTPVIGMENADSLQEEEPVKSATPKSEKPSNTMGWEHLAKVKL